MQMVKHNIHYESNYKNANQSAGALRWDCFDDPAFELISKSRPIL